MTIKEKIRERVAEIEGTVGLYLYESDSGETLEWNADEPIEAASVIKLLIMISCFQAKEEQILSFDESLTAKEEERVPGCGVISRLHLGLPLTIRDLVVLMIIVSDNTATNLLIDRIGIDYINHVGKCLGLTNTVLRRKMFDAELAKQGIINTVSARDMGIVLRGILEGTVVSKAASREMLDILLEQQLNAKIPFYLWNNPDENDDVDVAHKTGEDDGITHDVGILLGKAPKIMCFLSCHTYPPDTVRAIQEIARMFAYHSLTQSEATDF